MSWVDVDDINRIRKQGVEETKENGDYHDGDGSLAICVSYVIRTSMIIYKSVLTNFPSCEELPGRKKRRCDVDNDDN